MPTFIPWQAFVFGDANDFAAAFTTKYIWHFSQRLGGYTVALQLVTGPGGVTVCLEDDSSGVPSGNCVAGTSAYFSNAALPLWGFL